MKKSVLDIISKIDEIDFILDIVKKKLSSRRNKR